MQFDCLAAAASVAAMPKNPDVFPGSTLLPVQTRQQHGYEPLCDALAAAHAFCSNPSLMSLLPTGVNFAHLLMLLTLSNYASASRRAGEQTRGKQLLPKPAQTAASLVDELMQAIDIERSGVPVLVRRINQKQVLVDFQRYYDNAGGDMQP